MNVSLIVALDRNRVIGLNNEIPWRLPADLKHFRKMTMGKPIIMGRRTYESIGRPLTGRHNIIVTRNRGYQAEGCTIVHSVEEALTISNGGEVMVIGGAQLYEQFLPIAKRLFMTLLETEFEGDSYFPEVSGREWVEISRETYGPDDKNPYQYHFIIMERRDAVA
jgi:dihydrofolate reductase